MQTNNSEKVITPHSVSVKITWFSQFSRLNSGIIKKTRFVYGEPYYAAGLLWKMRAKLQTTNDIKLGLVLVGLDSEADSYRDGRERSEIGTKMHATRSCMVLPPTFTCEVVLNAYADFGDELKAVTHRFTPMNNTAELDGAIDVKKLRQYAPNDQIMLRLYFNILTKPREMDLKMLQVEAMANRLFINSEERLALQVSAQLETIVKKAVQPLCNRIDSLTAIVEQLAAEKEQKAMADAEATRIRELLQKIESNALMKKDEEKLVDLESFIKKFGWEKFLGLFHDKDKFPSVEILVATTKQIVTKLAQSKVAEKESSTKDDCTESESESDKQSSSESNFTDSHEIVEENRDVISDSDSTNIEVIKPLDMSLDQEDWGCNGEW